MGMTGDICEFTAGQYDKLVPDPTEFMKTKALFLDQ